MYYPTKEEPGPYKTGILSRGRLEQEIEKVSATLRALETLTSITKVKKGLRRARQSAEYAGRCLEHANTKYPAELEKYG